MPEQHRKLRSRFLARLLALAEDHGFRYQLRAISEVSWDGGLHDHYLLAADKPVTKASIRAAFARAAAGTAVAVRHEDAKSLEACVRYAYKATEEARDRRRPIRLHKPRLGPPIVWGTRPFTPGGKPKRAAIWAAHVAAWKGYGSDSPIDAMPCLMGLAL